MCEARAFGEFTNRLDASVARQPLRIENKVVEVRIFPLKVEQATHAARAGGIEFFDLLAHRFCIAAAEPLHHNAHSEIPRCAYSHADDLGYTAKQCGSAPSLDQHVAAV